MKLIPTLALVSLLVAVGTHAEARNNNNNDKRAIEQAKKQKAEREKKRAESKKAHEEITDYLERRDTNKDKSISKDEFLAAETDKAAGEREFNEHNKNKDRFLSRKEIQAMLGL